MIELIFQAGTISARFDRLHFKVIGSSFTNEQGQVFVRIWYKQYYFWLDAEGNDLHPFSKEDNADIPIAALAWFQTPNDHITEINALLAGMPNYTGEQVASVNLLSE